ncbi:hypothetical protein WJX84_005314 [Apatococcus fuscideae]|uniref:non-specific serine/threonine protein kinase n=1 Tax=Apatococcus fuscideae TaxID=2026836 RepID=A0AAW1SLW8_9CHLO
MALELRLPLKLSHLQVRGQECQEGRKPLGQYNRRVAPSQKEKDAAKRNHYIAELKAHFEDVDSYELIEESPQPLRQQQGKLLQLCGQAGESGRLPSMGCLLGRHLNLKGAKKLGEGTYGEAFKAGGIVIKIVPIEGACLVNGFAQTQAFQILAEASISLALSGLRPPGGVMSSKAALNATLGFAETFGCGLCHGPYAPELISAWGRWDDLHGSENDPVGSLPSEQMYAAFLVADGGVDLESFEIRSMEEARSILLQTVIALAVAEEALGFEHRDLHWGNLLIRRATTATRPARLRGVDVICQTKGVEVTLIDFTLSRLDAAPDKIAFSDLSTDPELFQGPKGDPQAETYRRMQAATKGKWQDFTPATNCHWVHYLAEILLTLKMPVKASAKDKRSLRSFRKRALDSSSCQQLLWDSEFAGLWTTTSEVHEFAASARTNAALEPPVNAAAKPSKPKKRKQQATKTGPHDGKPQPVAAELSQGPAKKAKSVESRPAAHAEPAAANLQAEIDIEHPTAAAAANEAERLLRTVFVGNLPATIRPKTLKRIFSIYGHVESVRLRSQSLAEDSKLPTRVAVRAGHLDAAKGTAHAYMVFATVESAHAALAHNMQEVEGLHVRVDRASERRASKKDDAGVFYHPGRTLFVGNLPFDANDEEVIRLFNSLQDRLALEKPPVTAVRVVREPRTGKGRGIAYVELAAKNAVSGALRLLQGNPLRGRELRLERVTTAGAPSTGTAGKPGFAKAAVERPKGAAVDAWQGVRTKGQFKRARPGFAVAKPAQSANGISPRRQARAEISKQKRSGKRPSIAARKATSKGHLVRPDKKKLTRKKEAKQQRKA